MFFIAAGVYIFCATFYNLFASGERQVWDNPENDDAVAARKELKKAEKKKLSGGNKVAETTN